MKLTKEKVKASNIAVDVIDLIETKVNETVQDNDLKEQLIDLVLELVNDHYKTELSVQNNFYQKAHQVKMVEMMNDILYDSLRPKGLLGIIDNTIEKLRGNR